MLEQLDLIGHLPNTVHTFNYKAGGLLAVLLEFLGENASLQVPFTDQTINRSLTESELHLLRQINAIFKKQSFQRGLVIAGFMRIRMLQV